MTVPTPRRRVLWAVLLVAINLTPWFVLGLTEDFSGRYRVGAGLYLVALVGVPGWITASVVIQLWRRWGFRRAGSSVGSIAAGLVVAEVAGALVCVWVTDSLTALLLAVLVSTRTLDGVARLARHRDGAESSADRRRPHHVRRSIRCFVAPRQCVGVRRDERFDGMAEPLRGDTERHPVVDDRGRADVMQDIDVVRWMLGG